MKTAFGKKLLKTLVYRLTASGLAQMLSWSLFHRVEINVAVLVVDLVQMGYYFFFESTWNRRKDQSEAMKRGISFTYQRLHTCRALLKRRGYSDKVVKEIWKWYGLPD